MTHSRDTADDSRVSVPPLALILTASEGSRLARQRDGTPKPALSLLGLSLVERTITYGLAVAARVER